MSGWENRFTVEDRDRIEARIAAAARKDVERLARNSWGDSVRELACEGAWGIGCDWRDLRDSELDEIDGMADRILWESVRVYMDRTEEV